MVAAAATAVQGKAGRKLERRARTLRRLAGASERASLSLSEGERVTRGWRRRRRRTRGARGRERGLVSVSLLILPESAAAGADAKRAHRIPPLAATSSSITPESTVVCV